ncbi:MAG: AtpZ/AtpI family protein [Clostridia bacterium]|nr:AtpZ/AtpI family protein [Clostridia bacterium]
MNRESTKALALFTQIAVSMIVPIFLCFFAGYAIDRVFGINGIFLIIFTIIGVMAGFRSVYVLVKDFYKDKDTYIDMNKIKADLQKEAQEDNNDK